MACGVIVAVSPWLTWFRATQPLSGTWSGFGLHAARDDLRIAGNALIMGFDRAGWYSTMFGPAVPLLAGLALGLGGLVTVRQRARATPTRTATWTPLAALWSLGAAGMTGAAGRSPRGDIGGAGVRAWAIASALGAVALGVQAASNPRPPARSAMARGIVEWLSIPAILLGGASAALLARAEKLDPFAGGPVFVAATLTAAFPAAGTVAALLAAAPPERPLAVVVVNASAMVLGGLLFVLWAQAALS